MSFGIFVILLTIFIACMVNYLLREPASKPLSKSNEPRIRFFKLTKPTLSLCPQHLNHLKVGQVALVSNTNCKVCIDNAINKR